MEALKEILGDLIQPCFLWTLAGIVMLFMEMLIPGLVIFFFGVGALLTALVCAIFPISVNVQLILFLVFSLASLFGLRHWLKRVFVGQTTQMGGLSDSEKEFLGERAVTLGEIPAFRRGKVMFHGTVWEVESEEAIEADCPVVIVGKRSTVLKVRKAEAEQEETTS